MAASKKMCPNHFHYRIEGQSGHLRGGLLFCQCCRTQHGSKPHCYLCSDGNEQKEISVVSSTSKEMCPMPRCTAESWKPPPPWKVGKAKQRIPSRSPTPPWMRRKGQPRMVVHTIEQTAQAAPPPNSSESELQLPWRQQPEDIQSRLLLDLLLDASDDHTSPLHHSGMTSYGISANGGILMAVKCANSSTELAQQSASLLMQEIQCSTKCVGEREIAYKQLEAWPFYEDVKELHIWVVRLMEGPHKGLTAVSIGGKKIQRQRAGRIALCLQAMYQGKIVGDPSLQPLFPFKLRRQRRRISI